MNFTPQESKSIQRLRNMTRLWRWTRWLLLLIGILSAALCAGFGYLLHALIAESKAGLFDGEIVFFIVVIWTKCCIYFLLGAWCFITVSLKWHGDVNRMLLLRLLDEQQRVV
jgi:hypothetical protein